VYTVSHRSPDIAVRIRMCLDLERVFAAGRVESVAGPGFALRCSVISCSVSVMVLEITDLACPCSRVIVRSCIVVLKREEKCLNVTHFNI
jgi:hypothetical protein